MSGCALFSSVKPPAIEIGTAVVAPPPALRACAAAPAVPAGTITDLDAALYQMRLWAAWDDCKRKLEGAAESVTLPEGER